MWNQNLREQEGGIHIHTEYRIKLLLADVPEILIEQLACVVYENVELHSRPYHLFLHFLPACPGSDLRAYRNNVRGMPLQPVRATTHGKHLVGRVLREPERRLQPYASRSPGDQYEHNFVTLTG